jgi:protocatechuate 3,4-dioxygenase, beta subunit
MLKSRRGALAYLGASALAAACASAHDTTPAETEGPFFPVDTSIENDVDLTRLAGRNERAAGQVIEVRGRLLNTAGRPVSDTQIELWQANAAGRYAHPEDSGNAAPLDPNFQGYSMLLSGPDGRFTVTTIMPGAYMVANQGPRTPHLHWKIGLGGRQLITQSYFEGDPRNDSDFLIRAMGEPVRQLIARAGAAGEPGALGFDWEVVIPV